VIQRTAHHTVTTKLSNECVRAGETEQQRRNTKGASVPNFKDALSFFHACHNTLHRLVLDQLKQS
jgi:hypothetical protein